MFPFGWLWMTSDGGDDAQFDPLWKWFTMGVLLPAVVVAWAAVQLWQGVVWLPNGRREPGLASSYHDPFLVAGVVVAQVGLAVHSAGQYVFKNVFRDSYAYVWPVYGGLAATAAGMLLGVVGMLRQVAGF